MKHLIRPATRAGDCPDFRAAKMGLSPSAVPHFLSPSAAPHRGVSLLEVLISIFVLSIGLLGVAAVIPVGGHEILQAVKADRAATIGPAVLEDMKVRGMLKLGTWNKVDPLDPTKTEQIGELNPYRSQFQSEQRGYLFGESYAIDPLYMAATSAADRPNLNDFPYNPRSLGTPVGGGWTRLQRVTWNQINFNSLLAEALCIWRDDLVIPVPGDDTERPRMTFFSDTGSGRPFPQLPGEPLPGNPLLSQSAGHYTYLVTVSPSAAGHDFVNDDPTIIPGPDDFPYAYSENTSQYEVSVVVFYRRDMSPPSGGTLDDPPSERQVRLKFLGSGLGGGDVLLSLFPGEGANRVPYLDVKENEWLMVSGGYSYAYYLSDGTPALKPIGVHKWYRVLAVGETVIETDANLNGRIDPGEDINGDGELASFREATLAGPDWNTSIWNNDFDLNGVPDALYLATLTKGAVGVYTKTVEFDW